MGPIKCFSVCFQIFLRKNIYYIFLAGRMQDGAQYLDRPKLMLLVWTTLFSFRCWTMWSSSILSDAPPSTQHGICTDYCFIMKSNCYEVILRPKKPKTMDSSLIYDYYQLLESHGLLHFVLSVFIYMKCYFIQDFIVIKVRWNPI